MPVTLNFFATQRFVNEPEDPSVVFQLDDRELRGQPETLLVEYVGKTEDPTVVEYKAKNEIKRKIAGRIYTGEQFHEFYQTTDIGMYFMPDRNLCFCKSNKRNAKNLIDRLNYHYPSRVRFDYYEFDFAAIRPKVEELRGIWVGSIAEPNIDTIGMFGMNVDKSAVYDALKAIGKASSILIPFDTASGKQLVIVSSKGSLTFLQALNPDHAVDVALQMADSVLSDAFVQVDSKATKLDKRKNSK